VARLGRTAVSADDPLDFLSSAEVVAIYDLYRTQYLRLDARLNIRTPAALLEYNRWVIVVDRRSMG